MMRSWIAGIALACLLGAGFLGGTAPFGRVLMGLGFSGVAAELFQDPAWRGAALYQAGDHEEAVNAFTEARAYLNLGNAQVQRGAYAAALEAYDIARLAGDARAAANFDLVAAFYAGLPLDPEVPIAWFAEKDGDGPAVEASIAQGSGRAAGTGSGVTNSGALLGLPEIRGLGSTAVRKVFDDKFIVANRRWLQTLQDVPGTYLAARIKHEHKRRKKQGLSPPEPEDPR